MVPTMASETEPPIWRKKVRFEVATPRSWKGTAFWMMMVKTAKVGPTPRPAMNIQNQTMGNGVVDVSWVISADEMAIRTMAPDDQPLVAAGARDDEAGDDRAEDQADHQRQGRQAGLGRAEAVHELEPARQEDDGAEEGEAGEEGRDHRRRVGAQAEEMERDDRLLGPPLGEDEQDDADERDEDEAADRRVGPVAELLVGQARPAGR